MGSCPSQKKKDADGKGHKISKNLLKLATNKNALGPVPRNILGLEFVQCSKFPQLHFLSVIQWNLWSGGCAFRIHHQEAEKGRRGWWSAAYFHLLVQFRMVMLTLRLSLPTSLSALWTSPHRHTKSSLLGDSKGIE